MRAIIATVVVLLVAGGAAQATPAVDAGQHILVPGQAGQEIQILVTGGDAVQGLELNAQIQDGESGPVFEDGEILVGTIFEGNNTGENIAGYVEDQVMYLGTTTAAGTVSANGVLARLTIDAGGVPIGVYALSLTNKYEGATNFAGLPADLTDGTLVVAIPGDITLDDFVGGDDLDIVLGNWGKVVSGWTHGDVDANNFVGGADLDMVLASWGWGTPPAASVPEPATLALLASAGVALLRRRSR